MQMELISKIKRRTRLNTFCVIENAGLKGNLITYLWTYLKVLDPVFKLEEYPDPRF